MAGGGVFILNGDDLVELAEEPYGTEADFQHLLAQHPEILVGEQMNPESPRRWLLIARELGVPDQQDGADRWSVDHLFVDQDAVPTIVEVKRSADTRIRREVVGQMLDYAANGLAYWPVDQLRARFTARCERESLDPENVLGGFLADPEDTADFWQQLKTNLQAGRVRLVFVADAIPAELRRVIEFLNGQMDPAEVLGVEIRRYRRGDLATLVPRVVGQTEQAKQKKAGGAPKRSGWDESTFFEALAQRVSAAEVHVARALLDWSKQRSLRLWWGSGRVSGSFFPMVDQGDTQQWTFAVWTYGTVELQFQWMMTRRPFDAIELRQELRRRLNAIDGIDIPEEALTRRPTVPLSVLVEPARLSAFLGAFDWVLEKAGFSAAGQPR